MCALWGVLERSGLYRKCSLEEIKLPLVSGNLKNVPEEVHRSLSCAHKNHIHIYNQWTEFTRRGCYGR